MATPQPLKAPADFKIGVLTSGGDAQGLNAAVQNSAITRVGMRPRRIWSNTVLTTLSLLVATAPSLARMNSEANGRNTFANSLMKACSVKKKQQSIRL